LAGTTGGYFRGSSKEKFSSLARVARTIRLLVKMLEQVPSELSQRAKARSGNWFNLSIAQ